MHSRRLKPALTSWNRSLSVSLTSRSGQNAFIQHANTASVILCHRAVCLASVLPFSTLSSPVPSCALPILVTTVTKASELVRQLIKQGKPVGLDVEGVRVSRSGILCLAQIATQTEVFVFDCTLPSIPEALAPLLESDTLLKISHDPREDNSNFYYQYGIAYRNVVDTQIAVRKWSLMQNKQPADVGLQYALDAFLGVRLAKKNLVKKLMNTNPMLWIQRPLSKLLLGYAAQDVKYLYSLFACLEHDIGSKSMASVFNESESQLCYRNLNEDITNVEETVFQVGCQLNVRVVGLVL